MGIINFKKKDDKTETPESTGNSVKNKLEGVWHWWLVSYAYLTENKGVGIGTYYTYKSEFTDVFNAEEQASMVNRAEKFAHKDAKNLIITGISYLGKGTKDQMIMFN